MLESRLEFSIPMEILSCFTLKSSLQFIGGLTFLLYGLDLMSMFLRKASGNTLRLILEKATENNLVGILIGTVVTAVIQSSSAMTTILVSFVQSGLISFERSIAVTFGANIGTTVTTQIIAFHVTQWAYLIIGISYLTLVLAQRSQTKNIATVGIGLGLAFLGLENLSEAMKVLRDSEYFVGAMQGLENVWWGMFVGMIFTALIHSSSGVIGICMGLAMQGLMSIEAAVPIILGANIGTCITALLASTRVAAEAKRVAASHIIFNVSGAVLFGFIVAPFIDFLHLFTPADDIPRMIANAQTIFNIASVVIWYPFIKQLGDMSRWLVPADAKSSQAVRYSFPRVRDLSQSPELLLIQSAHAIKAYKNIVKQMLWTSRDYFINEQRERLEQIRAQRENQQEFRADILEFLSRVGKLQMSYTNISLVLNQIALVNEVEHIAFKLESSIELLGENFPDFDEKYAGLDEYFMQTIKCFSKSCNAVLNDSFSECKRINEHIDSLRIIEKELRNRSVDEIHEEANENEYQREKLNLWVLEFLRSVNSTSKRICYIVISQKSKIKHQTTSIR